MKLAQYINTMLLHRMTAVLLFAGMLIVTGCSATEPLSPDERPTAWATPVADAPVGNLYRVDAHLYRSAQPDAKGFLYLYDLGVRNDLNLRQYHDDESLLDDLNITYYRIKIRTERMTYEQLVEGVAFIMNADTPVLVHCRHGSDRTGTVVAGYRIVADGWSKEQAVEEFQNGGYGFHSFWFPNLPELLLSIDEETFRKDVRNYPNLPHP